MKTKMLKKITNKTAVLSLCMLYVFTSMAECSSYTLPEQACIAVKVVNRDVSTDAGGYEAKSVLLDAFDSLSRKWGGKIVWSMVLDVLSKRFHFERPKHVYFSIDDVWGEFVRANDQAIRRGNEIIKAARSWSDWNSVLNNEDRKALQKILYSELVFPNQLVQCLYEKLIALDGRLIVRSSAYGEDGFLQNLAGVLTSIEIESKEDIVQAISRIFFDAIEKIWFEQNGKYAIQGLPFVLEQPFGVGIEVDEFKQYDASGTALTDIAGHTSLQMVIGDASYAVNPNYPVTTRYIFSKEAETCEDCAVYPSYQKVPYEFRLRGKVFSVVDGCLEDVEKACGSYPVKNNVYIPVTPERALDTHKVLQQVEYYAADVLLRLAGIESYDHIPVPFDIEMGFEGSPLYIHQIRPDVGYKKTNLITPSDALMKKSPAMSTGFSIGATSREGITAPMVLVERDILVEDADAAIVAFESECEEPYIRVQRDIASRVCYSNTHASVLLEPGSSSEQAHNVGLARSIYKENRKDFIYAAIPNIKADLLSLFSFRPHPTIPHLWISKNDVTYFSDGLAGSFYLSDKSSLQHIYEKPLIDKMRIDSITMVSDFYEENREVWGAVQDEPMLVKSVLAPLFNRLNRVRSRPVLKMLAEYCKKGLDEELSDDDMHTLQNALLSFDLIKSALNNPLYSFEYESDAMKYIDWFYRNLKVDRNLFYNKDAEVPKEESKIGADKNIFRVLVVQDNKHLRSEYERSFLAKFADNASLVMDTAASIGVALKLFKTYHYEYVFFDADVPNNFTKEHYALYPTISGENYLKRKYYENISLVRYKTLSSVRARQNNRLENEYGIPLALLNDIDDREEDNSKLCECIDRYYQQWQESRESDPDLPQTNILSDTFNILYVQDYTALARATLRAFDKGLSGNELIAIDHVEYMGEAVKLLENKHYDYVIFDVALPAYPNAMISVEGLRKLRAQYYSLLEEVPRKSMWAMGGALELGECGVPQQLLDSLDNHWQRTDMRAVTRRVQEFFNEWCGKKEAEEASRKQEALRRQDNDMSNKFHVLYVQDDASQAMNVLIYLRDEFSGGSPFVIDYAGSLSEAIDCMENKKYQYVIFDVNLPGTKAGIKLDVDIKTLRKKYYQCIENVPHKALWSLLGDTGIREYGVPLSLMRSLDACWDVVGTQSVADAIQNSFDEWQGDTSQALRAKSSDDVGRKFRILFMDDGAERESLIAAIENGIVQEGRCEFVKVDNFSSAALELQNKEYDVVVFDVVAPGDKELFFNEIKRVPHHFCVSDALYGVDELAGIQKKIENLYYDFWQNTDNAFTPAKQEPFRVLLMNDNYSNVVVLEDYLRLRFPDQATFELEGATDYAAAGYALKQKQYDVVVFDVFAPGTAGKRKIFFGQLDSVSHVCIKTGALESEINTIVPDQVLRRVSNKDYDTDREIVAIVENAFQEYFERLVEKKGKIEGATRPSDTFKILIMNDNGVDRKRTKTGLDFRFDGCEDVEILEAVDYNRAYYMMAETKINVVIFDVMAPGLKENKDLFFAMLEEVDGIFVKTGCEPDEIEANVPRSVFEKIEGRFDGWDLSKDVQQKYFKYRELVELEDMKQKNKSKKTESFRVLVLDDEKSKMNRVIYGIEKELASNEGIEIVGVEDYTSACEYLSKGYCDVVVMDVNVETRGEKGFLKKGEFFKRLKTVGNIIVCSGVSNTKAELFLLPAHMKKLRGWTLVDPELCVKSIWQEQQGKKKVVEEDIDICVVGSDNKRLPFIVDDINAIVGDALEVDMQYRYEDAVRVAARNTLSYVFLVLSDKQDMRYVNLFVETVLAKNRKAKFIYICSKDLFRSQVEGLWGAKDNELHVNNSSFYVPVLRERLPTLLDFTENSDIQQAVLYAA